LTGNDIGSLPPGSTLPNRTSATASPPSVPGYHASSSPGVGQPAERQRAPVHEHDRERLAGGGDLLDQLELPARQPDIAGRGRLAAVPGGLADDDHRYVGGLGRIDRGPEAASSGVGRTRIGGVERGATGRRGHVRARVRRLDPVDHRDDLALGDVVADRHVRPQRLGPVIGQRTDHGDVRRARAQRQRLVLVVQQDHRPVGHRPGRVEVRLRELPALHERIAPRLGIAEHAGQVFQGKDVTDRVVELRRRDLPRGKQARPSVCVRGVGLGTWTAISMFTPAVNASRAASASVAA
jgi:hypothetical protein